MLDCERSTPLPLTAFSLDHLKSSKHLTETYRSFSRLEMVHKAELTQQVVSTDKSRQAQRRPSFSSTVENNDPQTVRVKTKLTGMQWAKVLFEDAKADTIVVKEYPADPDALSRENEELRRERDLLRERLRCQSARVQELEVRVVETQKSESEWKAKVHCLEEQVRALDCHREEAERLQQEISQYQEESVRLRTSRQEWERSLRDSLAIEKNKMERTIRQLQMECDMRAREKKNLRDSVTKVHAERDVWRKEKATFINEMQELFKKVDCLKQENEKLRAEVEASRCHVCVPPAAAEPDELDDSSHCHSTPPAPQPAPDFKPTKLDRIPELHDPCGSLEDQV
mmetsp:Transcript_10462/g.18308  ORF Transcript_10462/g.18308 Transcript_10462/m.18308 type:complete len:341 (-) Transcript_10462:837-1859(-)